MAIASDVPASGKANQPVSLGGLDWGRRFEFEQPLIAPRSVEQHQTLYGISSDWISIP